MCDIPVTFPTIAKFLMLYSLRCGCIVVLVWTMFRSLFCIVWLMVTFILMYMPDTKHDETKPEVDSFAMVFSNYIIMIVTECFVFVFSIYLGVGIYNEYVFQLQQYLICRCCAFLFEMIALVALCFHHQCYIGWYLMCLMIVILELYAFVVVYSYYVELFEEQQAKVFEESELNSKGEFSESTALT